MGSKKYKGKPCAYCGVATSSTADHVFSRALFPVGFRADLPKAPACQACNNVKSGLESYLSTVLPFGSDHPAGLVGQVAKIKRRLFRQAGVLKGLRNDARITWVETAGGFRVPTLSLPLDGERFVQYIELGIRGLVWHESSVVLPPTYVVEVFTLANEVFEAFAETVLALGSATKVDRSFAKGALKYTTAHAPDDPCFATWNLALYDGLGIASEIEGQTTGHLHIVAVTGPPSIRRILASMRSRDV